MKINPNLEVKPDQAYYTRFRTWPSIFGIRSGTKILDVGCGRGNLGSYLQTTYGSEVTGLEIIKDNLSHLQSFMKHTLETLNPWICLSSGPDLTMSYFRIASSICWNRKLCWSGSETSWRKMDTCSFRCPIFEIFELPSRLFFRINGITRMKVYSTELTCDFSPVRPYAS